MTDRRARHTHRKRNKSTSTGFLGMPALGEIGLEKKLYGETLTNLDKESKELSPGAREALELMNKAKQLAKIKSDIAEKENQMTVSLYISTSSGKCDVAVKTNAQSLDVFIVGLADALELAMEKVSEERRPEFIASMLKNAFPVAFAIAGYKADRVHEQRMLVCGAATPDETGLVAHSRM